MNRIGRLLFYAIVVAIYVVILAPIVVVIGVSFDATGLYQFPPRELTLKWFGAFFSSQSFFNSFIYVSLPVGLIVAFAASILGTAAAIALTRFRMYGRTGAELFFVSPLFVPDILFAAALYLVYANLGIASSLLTIAGGHLIIALPFVIRSVTAGLAGIDPRLEEAARSVGATRIQAFRLVAIPLLQSSIVSGAVFAFIVSFSDINLALFLSGPGTTTLPVQIYSQLQFKDDPTIAAASTLQVILVAALLFGMQKLFRNRLAI